MGFIKRYRFEVLLSLGIIASYFLIRTASLLSMPIFTDEAIYLRWAQTSLNDASWRFISLTDGKQPMFVWVAMIFMKFIEDPLTAGRLVSVFTGFFTLIGLWFLSFELFKNKKISFLATILYVFYPFAQVYDRMALMDSMVGAFSVWALYFSVLLIRKVRLDVAYTLGFVIGGGALTKSSNFFSMYLLPFVFVLFDFSNKKSKRFLKAILLSVFAVLIAQGMYFTLKLSPLFQMIETKNATFVYPFSEWINHPFTFFVGNMRGLKDWLFSYLGISYLTLIIVSLISYKRFIKEKLLLIIYFFLPLVALALFGKVIFPRFIFFMSLFLLPLAAYGLNEIINFINKTLKNYSYSFLVTAVITLIFITYPGYTCYKLIVSPMEASIASSDHNQYLDNWTAGWAINDTISFFNNEIKKGPVFIGTEGTFGLMPESLELYLVDNKNVTIKGYWPVDEFPKEAIAFAQKMPSYFIFYQPQHQEIPLEYPVEKIYELEIGTSGYFYRIYKIIPETK
ncbi:MAG TPA: glycosyltransferase family 39 protein [Patescibacteria group bacterium]|nr:glycosyltransferase family 39 protein [Patescibacteria group bacterium]